MNIAMRELGSLGALALLVGVASCGGTVFGGDNASDAGTESGGGGAAGKGSGGSGGAAGQAGGGGAAGAGGAGGCVETGCGPTGATCCHDGEGCASVGSSISCTCTGGAWACSGAGGAGGSGGAGGCSTSNCGPPFACCADSCIYPNNDPLDCGGCGTTCPGAHPFCANGACATPPCNGQTCGPSSFCCGATCCADGQLCCQVDGPGPTGGPTCYTPTSAAPTCPKGCPLCG